jgi:hypothetical protein
MMFNDLNTVQLVPAKEECPTEKNTKRAVKSGLAASTHSDSFKPQERASARKAA